MLAYFVVLVVFVYHYVKTEDFIYHPAIAIAVFSPALGDRAVLMKRNAYGGVLRGCVHDNGSIYSYCIHLFVCRINS